ncbi:hypothetical protein BGZ54_009417, partial [Gamsiella multidivaricata]
MKLRDLIIADEDASIDLLQFGNLSITDDHGADDPDGPEPEAIQAKAEYNDAWSRFRELSESLKNTCEGDAFKDRLREGEGLYDERKTEGRQMDK